MFSLKDKVAVITGASQGMGLATAKRFVEAGAKVVIADIKEETENTAKEVGCIFVKTDVSLEEDVKKLMETANKFYGKIDICVNNAGITLPEIPITDTKIENLKRVIDINLFGVLWGLKYAPNYMPDGASIINTASLGAIAGWPGYGPYCAAKAGVIALTRNAALELAERKIRVNCICPATIDTPMAYAEGCENELTLAKYLWPLGRMGQADEVAAVIHFLAADDCKYITGQEINIDGGWTAGMGVNLINRLLGE